MVSPRRAPVPHAPWRTFQEPLEAPGAVTFGGTLSAIAIAVGLGVLGSYMLDLHSHSCARCGWRWRHFGAFNLNDEPSHTCSSCGEVQWWKDGAPHVLRGSEFVTQAPSTPAPLPSLGAYSVPGAPVFAAAVPSPVFAVPAPSPSPFAALSPGGSVNMPGPALPLPSRAPMLALQARKVPR